jgi:hypothetical protein
MTTSGDFLVTWTFRGALFGQAFDRNGARDGGAVRLVPAQSGSSFAVSMAGDQAVVAWERTGRRTPRGVYVRRFAQNRAPRTTRSSPGF